MKQDYKWSLIYDVKLNRFEITGFVHVKSFGEFKSKWSRDGEVLFFPNLEEALLSIKRTEPETSKTQDY